MRLFESIICAAAAALAAGPVPAAAGPEGGREGRIAAVAGEVMAGSRIRENLRVLCDEIGGRVTGTDAGRRARAFAESLLVSYGLASVGQEPFEFIGWEGRVVECAAISPRPFRLEVAPLAYTPPTPDGGLEAEVIDAGYGSPEEIEALGAALRGRLALVLSGRPPGGRWMHRSEVMAAVADAGAAGLLYESGREGKLPMTGMCWFGGLSPIPGVGVSREDGEALRRMLSRGERVRLRLVAEGRAGPSSSANVVGEIPGSGDEFVVVGAHLDSWDNGQGAIDNGTGVAIVIEAARAIAASGIRPAASIRVVLFMGEETGLDGSRAWVERHRGELRRCRAMINCDMEGTPLGLRVMGREEARPWFEELLRDLDAFEPSEGISTRASLYGDHHHFLLAGVPVVTPISRIENDAARWYHTSADTYDKLTFRQLGLGAAFLAAAALEIASTGERVMTHLDREGVAAMIDRHGLDGAIRIWGGWDAEPSAPVPGD